MSRRRSGKPRINSRANAGSLTLTGRAEQVIASLERLGSEADQSGDHAGAHGYWQAAEHLRRSSP